MAFTPRYHGPLFVRSEIRCTGALQSAVGAMTRPRSIQRPTFGVRPSSLPLIPDRRVMAGHPGRSGLVRNLGDTLVAALGGKA